MAEFFPPVIFEIKAHATEAIASFKEVNHELASMEKNGMLAGGSLGKLEKAAKYSRTALLGLAGVFGVIAFTSVEALDKVEKAQANLETAIKNTGVAFETAKPYIDANNYSMMQLGFTTDDVYGALAKMTAASGSPKMALQSLAVAADLARFKNMSLADAGTLVARASIGQAKGLGDLGLALGKTIPKGASFAQILKAIEDRAGGAGKAFSETLSGKILTAKANFQALQVKIGTDLVPVLIKFTDWITIHGIPGLEKMAKWIKENKGLVELLIGVLATLWVAPKIENLINAINTIIKAFKALKVAAVGASEAEAVALGGEAAVGTGAAGLALTAALVGGYAAGAIGATPITKEKTVTAKQVFLRMDGSVIPEGSPEWKRAKAQQDAATALSTNLTDIGGTALKKTSTSSTPKIDPNKIPSSLTGHPVKTITTPKKVTTPAAKQTTVIQNITVNASNTNDISKKMARAAKTGIPIGGK